MLEDFDPTKPIDAELRKRFTSAVALAAILLGSLFAYAVVVSRRAPVAEEEVDTEVTFEDAPPVPDEPEAPEPEQAPEQNFDPRPAVIREAMQAPTEIPDEQLEESAAELVAVGESGPVDGNLGGTGRAGSLVRSGLVSANEDEDEEEEGDREEHFSIEDATAPRLLDGCRSPSFPNDAALVGQVVRVRCTIGIDGTPTCSVISGPEAARAVALECAQSRRYEPARFPNGTPTPYPKGLTFTIGGS